MIWLIGSWNRTPCKILAYNIWIFAFCTIRGAPPARAGFWIQGSTVMRDLGRCAREGLRFGGTEKGRIMVSRGYCMGISPYMRKNIIIGGLGVAVVITVVPSALQSVRSYWVRVAAGWDSPLQSHLGCLLVSRCWRSEVLKSVRSHIYICMNRQPLRFLLY